MIDMPAEFERVIDMARTTFGEYFFISGGCGVLAALLAEVAQAKGLHGSLYLLIRVTDGDSYLSHICFGSSILTDTYDITGGDDAFERWEQKIHDECLEMRGEDPAFEYEKVVLDADSNIFEILKDITSEHFLNVPLHWVEAHYPSLRDRALSVAGFPPKTAAA